MSLHRVESFAKRRGTIPSSFDLLAIDPGVHTGWAVFTTSSASSSSASGGRLLACGLGDPPVEPAARVGTRIVIELPQIYPRQQVPPNDLLALAFLAGRYAGRAGTLIEVFTVLPHQWKGNLPKEVCAARVRVKLSPEEKAVVDACAAGTGATGSAVPEKQMHNVMDAVGIGLFALGRRF